MPPAAYRFCADRPCVVNPVVTESAPIVAEPDTLAVVAVKPVVEMPADATTNPFAVTAPEKLAVVAVKPVVERPADATTNPFAVTAPEKLAVVAVKPVVEMPADATTNPFAVTAPEKFAVVPEIPADAMLPLKLAVAPSRGPCTVSPPDKIVPFIICSTPNDAPDAYT